jgi:DNA-binding transcriptional MerR regulator
MSVNTYSTSQIAAIIGIHPNTVRFYEEMGLIPPPYRKPNGYRVFDDFHVEQFRLARVALRAEVIQNGLRKRALEIIKASAKRQFDKAIELTKAYIAQIDHEQRNAEEAIIITKDLLAHSCEEVHTLHLTRKEAARHLHITMDTLRNWELNGLLTVKRMQNGYRIYEGQDVNRLKIIRCLRCANYSLSSILRMFSALSENKAVDLHRIIDTPEDQEDIISVCDRLLSSLAGLKEDARDMHERLVKMKQQF